jgi:MinD superfamily P-loop ATPase
MTSGVTAAGSSAPLSRTTASADPAGQTTIAIASGKGGTGKSFIALNLACTVAMDREVVLLDCDVEEPNLHLFFSCPWDTMEVTQPVPVIDPAACTRCGRCGEACQYGAMTVLADRVLFLERLCHSCGACALVCPEGAIREEERIIGTIQCGRPLPKLTLVTGILNEGEVSTTRMIRKVKEMGEDHPFVIADGPPGTACPVIETMDGCDICLLVTEPTPFGLHDLKKAAAVAEKLGIPTSVVINRSVKEDQEITAFCTAASIPILAKIPFNREIAHIHGRGSILTREKPEWQSVFREIVKGCNAILSGNR